MLEGSLGPPFWPSPLQIEYFNNATIVELVEQPRRGILAVLDEACSTAGPITDRIFLQTLDTHHRHHPHYSSRQVFSLSPMLGQHRGRVGHTEEFRRSGLMGFLANLA